MVQTSEEAGFEDSLYAFALSGSTDNDICRFQSRILRACDINLSQTIALSLIFTRSAACAAILEAITPSLTSSTEGCLKCSENLTEKQDETLVKLSHYQLKTGRAYLIKLALQ